MTLYHFHATIHARDSHWTAERELRLGADAYRALALDSNQLNVPFSITFEEAAERLLALPRMFCEPDGYFLLAGTAADVAWQVDGHLYDRQERLLYVAIKGTCPVEAFDTLLRAFGWPETALVFQLTREGAILPEEEFRRYAQSTR
jgi:hypothetical protein